MIYQHIGDVLGISVFDGQCSHVLHRIQRIAEKIGKKIGEFGDEDIYEAEKKVEEEGCRALLQSWQQCNSVPAPQVFKIARSKKGKRISITSPSGVNFSFGPVWNQSVVAGRGLALNPLHREKLNMHGVHKGIASPEALSARDLCAAIAPHVTEEELDASIK